LSAKTSAPPRRRRGLFDATLALLLLYAVYAKTPCGALPVWAIRTVQGQPTPDLLATFGGRETAVDFETPKAAAALAASRLLASASFPEALLDVTRRTGTDPELLTSYLAAHDERCEEPGCLVSAPPQLGQVLESYEPRERAPLLEVAQALALTTQRLGGDPLLGLEALFVSPVLVQRAVEQARASNLDAPEDVEVHAAFYSAGVRRGALQRALGVLALHRLRTLAWPADEKLRITSPFGWRVHPVLRQRRLHNGTDIGTPTGTPLFAAHHGVISRRGRDSVSGDFLKINHGFAIETTYCHLSHIDVKADQRVSRKQVVAKSGATGRVTGPHLHYILRRDNEPVDAELHGESPSRKVVAPSSLAEPSASGLE
jgi:murein DD-endopeptidase